MMQRILCSRLVRSANVKKAIGSNVSHYHSADSMFAEYPREREGLHYEFNWSLNADDVTPTGEAYRNLAAAKLESIAKDAKYEGSACTVAETGKDINYSEYDDLFEKVSKHFTRCEELFAHDGAVGSFVGDRTRVRIISDCPLVARLAQNMLVNVPLKDVHEKRPIVVYIAGTGAFKNVGPQAAMFVEENVRHIQGFFADDDKEVDVEEEDEGSFFNSARIVFAGTPSHEVLLKSIFKAKSKLMALEERQSALLPCDVMVDGDSTALVFNASDKSKASGVSTGAMYSAHGAIWSTEGVTSLLGGAVIESSKDGSKDLRNPLPLGNLVSVAWPCNNIVSHPQAAVFVTGSGGSSPKEISVDDAIKLISSADEDVNVDVVGELLKTHSPKLYAVKKDSDIIKALKA